MKPQPIFVFQSVTSLFKLGQSVSVEANSVDTDQTAPDLGLNCLSKRLLKYFNRRQNQMTFTVIRTLKLNPKAHEVTKNILNSQHMSMRKSPLCILDALNKMVLTLTLLKLSAGILFKQFGPRSGMTKCQV